MKLVNRIFNEIEYTLIEKFTELEDIGEIYYFHGDNDDVFCLMKGNKYMLINNEAIIDKIMRNYDLYPQEIWYAGLLPGKMAGVILGMKKFQKVEQKDKSENLNNILQKLKKTIPSTSLEELNNRLKGVNYYNAEWSDKNPFLKNVRSFFLSCN